MTKLGQSHKSLTESLGWMPFIFFCGSRNYPGFIIKVNQYNKKGDISIVYPFQEYAALPVWTK